MTSSLGALFLRAALGPVDQAGRCIMGQQAEAGLAELAPDKLNEALQRGIGLVAREAGVQDPDVQRLLPLAELQQTLAQLAQDQQQATLAWQQHAGHFGGLLEGLTDLTLDGQPPDVSLCLSRLALKVRADKAWSRPLKELSRSTFRYTEALRHCGRALDDGTALAQARAAKRARRALIAGGILLLVILSGIGATWMVLRSRNARQRVDEALTGADPCAVETIAAEDLELASEDQTQAVADRRQKCSDERERKQREEQARLAKEKAAKEKAEQARKRAEQCTRLAAAIAAGKLSSDDSAFAGNAAPLLEHVAEGKLTSADLAPPNPDLPCQDLPEGKTIQSAFEKAVVASTGAWLNATDLSDPVRKILTAHKAQLRHRPKLLFGLHAETKAKRALVAGEANSVQAALRLCDLKQSLEIVRGPYCDALRKSASD
ncbi:MAG: hypothetical protein JRI23_33265 [Deltaproteobacteria bacterium]|nr:hypothetical protein [Deltaproteobacteria bacterium]MBW2537148.1 hypothetical protein [Deltaproteobacteria bacterium]